MITVAGSTRCAQCTTDATDSTGASSVALRSFYRAAKAETEA
jgi:hypothetical protein